MRGANRQEMAMETINGQEEVRGKPRIKSQWVSCSVMVREKANEAQRWVSEELEMMEHCNTEDQRAGQKVDGSDDEVTQKRELSPKDG